MGLDFCLYIFLKIQKWQVRSVIIYQSQAFGYTEKTSIFLIA